MDVRGERDTGGAAPLLPQSPGGFRQLAVAAAAAGADQKKKKTGRKHPGKAILAGESLALL